MKLPNKKHNKKTAHTFHGTLILTLSAVLLFATGIVIYQTQQIQHIRGNAQTNVNCTVTTADLALDTEEKKMLDLINAYRKANGKPELKISPTLSRAALWLSTDMNTKKYLSHTDSLSRNLQTRLGNCGYPGYTSGSSENIAQTSPLADITFEAWKNSAIHNANMLNENWKVVGLARSGNYWTYDAGYVDDSASPTTPPSGTVPSPACLGACLTPSVAPATATPTTIPTATTAPTITETVTEAPTPTGEETPTEEPTTEPTPSGNGTGTNKGLISLFLDFIIKLLEFFASLLK